MPKEGIVYLARDGRPSILKVYSQMHGGKVYVKRTLHRRNKPDKVFLRTYVNNDITRLIKRPLTDLDFSDRIVVRWGNRMEFPTNEHTIVYNKAENLKLATNKKEARLKMLADGVSAPVLYTNQDAELTFPIIARPLEHSKGKNFVVLNNAADFQRHYKDGWYYSQFIDKTNEYRVHCAHGKVLAVMEKPRVEGQYAWNRAINHEAFERVLQNDYKLEVCQEALKAIKSMGLDFGGVDVVYKDNKAYVLEVNTSPTLNSSEYVSAQYAKYFTWLFRQDTRRDHWDFTQFTKAKSLAWKQAQLEG